VFAELYRLAIRHGELGITADLASLSLLDAYLLLSWLRRITGE
jgi:hypothetical protein